MSWVNQLFGSGLLDPEMEKRLSEQQKKQLANNAMMNAGLAMLANSGYSRTPITLGESLAQGLGAGRQAYSEQAQGLQAQYKAQMEREQAEQQRQSILQSLDPEIARFYQGLNIDQLQKAVAGIGRDRAKPQKADKAPSDIQVAQWLADPNVPEAQKKAYFDANRSRTPTTTVQLGSNGQPIRPGPLTPAEAAAEGLSPDRRWQRLKDGRVEPIKGTEPSDAEMKAPAVQNSMMMFDQMEKLLNEGMETGPIAGSEIAGIPIGRAVDYDRKTMFDAFVKQVSPNLRAIFRIKGEGALSDSEQKAYGLMMPQVTYPEEVNRQLIANLRRMLGNSVPQATQPATGGWRIVGVE